MTSSSKQRRKFLKATAISAGTAIPLVANGTEAIPPVISLLLGNNITAEAAPVLEGEGNGGDMPFDSNSFNVPRGSSTVENFYKRFRPDFFRSGEEALGFDELSVQLTPAVEQDVELTVSVVEGNTLTAMPASQTVTTDAGGVATFSKVLIPTGDFGGISLITENHTFELRFSSPDTDDFVSRVTFDLGEVVLPPNFTLEGEGSGSIERQTFNGEGQLVFNNFFQFFRPDFFSSGSDTVENKQLGLDNPSVNLLPRAVVEVTLTAEMIAGTEVDVEEASKSQTVTSNMFGFASFNKVFLTPQEFGQVGSGEANIVTTNHTVRLTFSAPGYVSSVAELTLDFESMVP